MAVLEELSTDDAAAEATTSNAGQDQRGSPATTRDHVDAPSAAEEGSEELTTSGGMEEGEAEKIALVQALAFKEQGNTHFVAGRYEEALDLYTEAIETAPENSAERAVFYANRAACYAKMEEFDAVIEDCTSALGVQPEYIKALLRRAQAHEALGRPTEALEDMRKIVELDPSVKAAANSIPRLEAASAAKLEEQKEEMLGKLKELGNSVLGKFGLSLDNFKAEKDPTTGSYNISFGQ